MKFFEKLIKRLKKEEQYEIEEDLSFYDIIKTIQYRTAQLLRGLLLRAQIGTGGLIFKGKNCRIDYKKYLCVGSNCIIEDNVTIKAISKNGIQISDNVTIAFGARLIGTGVIRNKGIGIKIGSNSAIGSNNFIGGQGGVEIGENVIMGPDVRIFSENHNIDKKDIAIKNQGESRIGVCISDDCWIGASVTILDGVKLSKGTVVAAGSVVTKSVIEPNMVIAGIPAKILKSRLQ